MIPQLTDLMLYKNENVLTRYRQTYPHSKMHADEAFIELMKFIWLCCLHKYETALNPARTALQFTCVIHEEMKEIDDMWHTFLLFTRDYHEFCKSKLGGHFFHHDPIVSSLVSDNYAIELERYLEYIHEKLGVKTVIKWFSY